MKRILLVEDDYDVGHSMVLGIRLIKRPRIEVEVEYEGASALARVQNRPAPDLLILDMHLPNVAGQDIYQAMLCASPTCKIVIATADIGLVREIGARSGSWRDLRPPDAVFIKPFSLIQFVETVRKLLKN